MHGVLEEKLTIAMRNLLYRPHNLCYDFEFSILVVKTFNWAYHYAVHQFIIVPDQPSGYYA
jgi:hypothetical protein